MQEKKFQDTSWKAPSRDDWVFLGVAAFTGAVVALLGGRGIRAILDSLIRSK